MLAKTVDQKEKNVISAVPVSETAIGFTEESNTLQVTDDKESVTKRFYDTIRSASRSADPVVMAKYASTVAVESLIVTEGEEERKRMRRKKRIEIIALR